MRWESNFDSFYCSCYFLVVQISHFALVMWLFYLNITCRRDIWCTLKSLEPWSHTHDNLFFMFVDPCIIVQFIKKNLTRCNMYQNFIIPYLYESQHVSDDTPPISRSLKLHWQPLVFHTWKVVGRVVGGRCKTLYLTTSTNCTSSNLPRMKTQRLPVQF